jgi:hypothetical protein
MQCTSAAPFDTKNNSFWKLHFDVFKQLHFGAASSVLEAPFWKLHFGAAIAVLELAASKWSFLESQGMDGQFIGNASFQAHWTRFQTQTS